MVSFSQLWANHPANSERRCAIRMGIRPKCSGVTRSQLPGAMPGNSASLSGQSSDEMRFIRREN